MNVKEIYVKEATIPSPAITCEFNGIHPVVFNRSNKYRLFRPKQHEFLFLYFKATFSISVDHYRGFSTKPQHQGNILLLLFRRPLKYYNLYYYTNILILLIFHIINMMIAKRNIL